MLIAREARAASQPPTDAAASASLARTIGDTVTLADAARRYLANREMVGLKPGTLTDYESFLRVHLLPYFGDQPLDSITIDDVEAFIVRELQQGSAPKSVLNYLGVLHAIYAHGVKRGWCTANPVALVDKPRNPRTSEIRYLSHDELEALLAATGNDPRGRAEGTLFLTGAMTGLRRGELLALRWSDIDWDAGVVRVRRAYTRGQIATPKTRRSNRAVPLAARLQTELRDHQRRSRFTAGEDLVFGHPDTGSLLDPSRVRKRFQAAARRAGLRPVRFHDLRHTFGTRMAAAGAPLRSIQEWLGHSDYRTTSIYADFAPDLSQAALWAARAFPEQADTA